MEPEAERLLLCVARLAHATCDMIASAEIETGSLGTGQPATTPGQRVGMRDHSEKLDLSELSDPELESRFRRLKKDALGQTIGRRLYGPLRRQKPADSPIVCRFLPDHSEGATARTGPSVPQPCSIGSSNDRRGEFGECSPEMQAKFLRALQPPPGKGPCHRVFQRLGESKERTSDVSIVAATNRDLLKDIRDNRFREDLYYRLAVITLKLPPLLERRTDIPLLAEALLEQINREFAETELSCETRNLSRMALAYVKRHP
jgi:hypothetical protein